MKYSTFKELKSHVALMFFAMCLALSSSLCNALDNAKAKSIQNNFLNTGSINDPEPTINADGKYKNKKFYDFCKRISSNTPFGSINDSQAEYAKKFKTKLDLLASNLGTRDLCKGLKIIDISYDQLKSFYDKIKKNMKFTEMTEEDIGHSGALGSVSEK